MKEARWTSCRAAGDSRSTYMGESSASMGWYLLKAPVWAIMAENSDLVLSLITWIIDE